MPAFTVTAVDTTANTLTATGVAAVGQPDGTVLLTGDRLRLRNVGGALPAATPALVGATDYWAVRVSDDAIKLSDSNAHALAGTNIVDLTGSGSGTTTIEFGLPYSLPTATAAAGTQIKSVNDRAAWASLVALYDLLTAQAQSVYTGVTLAGALSVGGVLGVTGASTQAAITASGLVTANAGLTAGANQHVTLSGTGKFKHGTKTIQLPFTTPGTAAAVNSVNFSSGTGGVYVSPIALPVGARILKVRAFAFDSATGPTKFVVGLRTVDSGGSSTLASSGSQSAGSGSLQTVESAAMTTIVTSGTRYWAEAQIQTGTANCAMQGFEVDYDQP